MNHYSLIRSGVIAASISGFFGSQALAQNPYYPAPERAWGKGQASQTEPMSAGRLYERAQNPEQKLPAIPKKSVAGQNGAIVLLYKEGPIKGITMPSIVSFKDPATQCEYILFIRNGHTDQIIKRHNSCPDDSGDAKGESFQHRSGDRTNRRPSGPQSDNPPEQRREQTRSDTSNDVIDDPLSLFPWQ